MKTMTNWSSFATGAGARITTWNYNLYRGWLDSKQYPDGQGPSYQYEPSGRLLRRTWGRGITTSYTYDNAGGLWTIGYSDSTPGVTYAYDRLGRQSSVTRHASPDTTTSFSYNLAGEQLSESYSGGTLDTVSVTGTYDTFLRRSTLTLNSQLSTLNSVSYGYDSAARLHTVTDNTGSPAYSATYTYLANSPLVSQIAFNQGATTRMTTTKQYDSLNRLTSISSVIGSSAIGNSYGYNNANQRIRSTLADGSYWVYGYDDLGQVTSGNKYWPDNSLVAGQQFQYLFDDIGNRQSTWSGGDNGGQGLHQATYTPNNLNQYVRRDVPGYVSSLGTANANATVQLWADGGTYAQASRHGDYFWAELQVNNGGALSVGLTNIALLHNGSNPDYLATSQGHQFMPPSTEYFTYDTDGNLTSDGHWQYTWDAENRLIELTPSTTVGPQISLKFEYDWKGRRIRKQVYDHAYWGGSITNDTKFVYDGWNLIVELNALTGSTLLRSYVWGSDLSGALQGAGGIGGLLFIRDVPSAIWYGPAFDGNGNIAALVSMADGSLGAKYEYGPFGEVIRATGSMAKANPLRFSTKYQDDETDLIYYGYRYYTASMGKWLSRDPLEERGGNNLYCFAGNDSIDKCDWVGLMTLSQVDVYIQARRKSIDSQNIMCRCGCGKREAIHKYNITGQSHTGLGGDTVDASTSWKDCTGSQCCGPFNSTYFWWDCYSSAAEGGKVAGDMNYGWSMGGPTYSKQANPSIWSSITQFFGGDPYHIDVDSKVVYEQCVNGKLQTQVNDSLNSVLFTWSRLWQQWYGPKILGPGQF